MNKIKNYTDWLNESGRWEDYEPEEILREICDEIINRWSTKYSYTTCAQSPSLNPDADFEKFMNLLRGRIKADGLNETNIMRAFKEADTEWFNCGLWDMVMFKALGPKSGVNLGGDLPGSENDHENVIRFAYGWHKTGYGQLFIENNYGSDAKFFETIPGSLKAELKHDYKLDVNVEFDNGKLIITSVNDLEDVQQALKELYFNPKIQGDKIIA